MKIFYIFWAMFFLVGITQNYKGYSLGDWMVLLIVFFFPLIFKKLKEKNVKNKRKNKVPPLKKVQKQEFSTPLEKGNKNLINSDKITTDEEVRERIKRDYQERLQQVNRALNKNTDIYPPNTEKYTLSSEEKIFLDKFLNQALENKIDLRIRTERRSNGEIFVEYRGCQVGRINLQDGNHSMQILRGMYGNKVIGGNLNDFIEEIPAWIRYIKYLKRNWNK